MVKTNQAVILVLYEEPAHPTEAATDTKRHMANLTPALTFTDFSRLDMITKEVLKDIDIKHKVICEHKK